MALKTLEELAADLVARGADLEGLALKAAKIAIKRGYVDAQLANGTGITAAKSLGYLKRDRRYKRPRYNVTPEGRRALQETGRE